MKKRYVVLIVIAALLVCTGSFLLITKGRVSVKDGVRQNSRVYITDIKLENGKISYTVVNKTFRSAVIGDKPDVQKKINGEWKPFPLYQSANDIAYSFGAFGEMTRSFEVDVQERADALTGEFRLIFGPTLYDVDKATGEHILSFKEDKTYIVGYLTITEEMLTGFSDDAKIHYTDGIRQSALVYIENAQYADGEVTYTLVNEREGSVSFNATPVIEKKVNGVWKYVPLCEMVNDDDQAIEVLKSRKRTFRFAVDAAGNDMAGEYRIVFTPFSFERWLYTDPDTGEQRLVIMKGVTCLVGYLTISE